MEAKSKSGAMAGRLAHSSTSTNAWMGVRRLMDSDFPGPVNVVSEEMVTINQLAETIMDIVGKRLSIRHAPGPRGVRGRNSDNALLREKLNWAPSKSLRDGLARTYGWIERQVEAARFEREFSPAMASPAFAIAK
jgi:hypothetical protein